MSNEPGHAVNTFVSYSNLGKYWCRYEYMY